MKTFARFAWATLALNLAVIAWGAYVRASGSGAGCGNHWPLCNGDILPRAARVQTLVEFSHRASSGFALVCVLGMAVWSFVAFPRGHAARSAAVASFAFICGEALIGAGLVLFRLVEHDASVQRGMSISLHLVNTFFLLGALGLTAWHASGGARVRLRGQGLSAALVVLPLLALLLVGTSGAIAALGDTLFPPRSLAEGFAQDAAASAHVFVRLRVWHPFLAAGAAALVLVATSALRVLRPSPSVRACARAASALVVVQIAAGLLNVYWLAPIPMQLVHLLLADALWLALVMLGAAALAEHAPQAEVSASVPSPFPGEAP
jgi:heme A synthase